MPTRSRKVSLEYKKHLQSERKKLTCVFCEIKGKSHPELIKETKAFKIIKNLFPYSQWDGQGVEDHLMIVPIKHASALSDLNSSEALEYLKIVSDYEKSGYSIYARSPKSTSRTVAHQHTHLIKLDKLNKNIILFIDKPRIRYVR